MVEVKVEVQDFQDEMQIDQTKQYWSQNQRRDEKHFSPTSFNRKKR